MGQPGLEISPPSAGPSLNSDVSDRTPDRQPGVGSLQKDVVVMQETFQCPICESVLHTRRMMVDRILSASHLSARRLLIFQRFDVVHTRTSLT